MNNKQQEAQATKLANNYRPKSFKDYLSSGGAGPAAVIKNVIKKNLHRYLGNILLAGPSGVGKSSIAGLYTTATLCLNREEGDCEPCGYCAVCVGEDRSNIHQYTIHNATTSYEPIRDLIAVSKTSPSVSKEGLRDDQYRRFIILDEIQNASPELLAQLLDALEYAPATTTWVLISMDIAKLVQKNAAVAEAITGRCAELSLPLLTDEVVRDALLSKVNLSEEGARAIAVISKGNMRKAWTHLAVFQTLVEKVEEITEELVYYSRAGGASKESRQQMWAALEKGNAKVVRELVTGWEDLSPDPSLILHLLQQDIAEHLHHSNTPVQSLLAALSRWQHGLPYPLANVLLAFLGTSIYNAVKSEEKVVSTDLDFPAPARVPIGPKQSRPVENALPAQTAVDKVLGAVVGASYVFQIKTMEALKEYLALSS